MHFRLTSTRMSKDWSRKMAVGSVYAETLAWLTQGMQLNYQCTEYIFYHSSKSKLGQLLEAFCNAPD